ncbi:hypothetical protein PO124_05140 [Bacillus licheniformis]|nr:hypothetical protein [Bacillus licheniformis]
MNNGLKGAIIGPGASQLLLSDEAFTPFGKRLIEESDYLYTSAPF